VKTIEIGIAIPTVVPVSGAMLSSSIGGPLGHFLAAGFGLVVAAVDPGLFASGFAWAEDVGATVAEGREPTPEQPAAPIATASDTRANGQRSSQDLFTGSAEVLPMR
jgi:hypothetical protein